MEVKHLLTLEAYKKAMRAAASQIKVNTPFCIFSEVLMPDASNKMHTWKPFVVVGSPANVVAQLLKDQKHLKGSKTLTGHGVCSLEGGKISFTAKSGKVDHGQLKSQATIFKDLLGKEIEHTPGGADHKAAELKAAALKAAEQKVAEQKAAVLKAAAQKAAEQKAAEQKAAVLKAAEHKAAEQKAAVLKAAELKAAEQKAAALKAAELKAAAQSTKLSEAAAHWHGVRTTVDGKLKDLKEAVKKHYSNAHPELIADIDKNMLKLDGILDKLDHKLTESLRASAAAGATARESELKKTREILAKYKQVVQSEALIAHIDKNPFKVDTNLKRLITDSLTKADQSIA